MTAWVAAALICALQDGGKVEDLRKQHEQAIRELEQQRRKIDEDFRRKMEELGAEGRPPRPPQEGERPQGPPPPPRGEGRPGLMPPPRPCPCEMKCKECHPQRPEGPRPPPPPREGGRQEGK